MDDICRRCRVQVGDYDGQLDEIIELVKIEGDEEQLPSKLTVDLKTLVTPGAPPSEPEETLARWKCPKCKTQYRNTKPECKKCDNQNINDLNRVDSGKSAQSRARHDLYDPNEVLARGVWRCQYCLHKNYESIEPDSCGNCREPRPKMANQDQQEQSQ